MTAPHETVAVPAFEVFADAMARLASGVAVVTARHTGGHPHGLLVSSLCSYSASPPSLLVVIGQQRASYPAVTEGTQFGVHLLGLEQERLAKRFAGRIGDKFADAAWEWHGAIPRLRDVPVFLSCVRRRVFPDGDAAVIIGDIVEIYTRPGQPLVYYERRLGWRLR